VRVLHEIADESSRQKFKGIRNRGTGGRMNHLLLAAILLGISGCSTTPAPAETGSNPAYGCLDAGGKQCPVCGHQTMCCEAKQQCKCTSGAQPEPYCQ